jgi:integrase
VNMHLYKPKVTKPLPAGAEIVTRKGRQFARWQDTKGKPHLDPVTVPKKGKHAGQQRVVLQSRFYVGKYRDGTGIVRIVPTKCRTEDAARQVMADLVRRAELVKAKVLTPAEDAVADQQRIPLEEHIAAYEEHLRTHVNPKTGFIVGEDHRGDTMRCIRVVTKACNFTQLCQLNRSALERWQQAQKKDGMTARSRKAHITAMCGFGNWCVDTLRLVGNPFARLTIEKSEPVRPRRAFTREELAKLITVTRTRPLWDKALIRRGEHKGQHEVKLKDRTKERLLALGYERALIYKMLAMTGLRLNELRSLTVGQLELAGKRPYAILHPADEKARRGADIPLRADLVADLKRWLDYRLGMARKTGKQTDATILARLPADTPLFTVPDKLVKILNRDLVAAGLAHRVAVSKDKESKKPRKGQHLKVMKADERGRVLDVHSFRHTFASFLAAGNVSSSVRRRLMRHHSASNLTDDVYTDPKLLDLWGALDVLPPIPLDGGVTGDEQRATGTDGASLCSSLCLPSTNQAQTGQAASDPIQLNHPTLGAVSDAIVESNATFDVTCLTAPTRTRT